MAKQLADLPDAHTTAAVVLDPDNSPDSVVTVTMQHDFRSISVPFEGSTFTFDATASMTIVR